MEIAQAKAATRSPLSLIFPASILRITSPSAVIGRRESEVTLVAVTHSRIETNRSLSPDSSSPGPRRFRIAPSSIRSQRGRVSVAASAPAATSGMSGCARI